jgi:hypothetical protein
MTYLVTSPNVVGGLSGFACHGSRLHARYPKLWVLCVVRQIQSLPPSGSLSSSAWNMLDLYRLAALTH